MKFFLVKIRANGYERFIVIQAPSYAQAEQLCHAEHEGQIQSMRIVA
jgi:hypothetical protein